MSTSPELSDGGDGSEIMAEFQESGFSHLMNKELYPVREKVVGKYMERERERKVQANYTIPCHSVCVFEVT